MGLAIPSIKATLSDREYALITSVAGANVSEPLRIPPHALWLEERVLQHSAPGDEADSAGGPSQVCTNCVHTMDCLIADLSRRQGSA